MKKMSTNTVTTAIMGFPVKKVIMLSKISEKSITFISIPKASGGPLF